MKSNDFISHGATRGRIFITIDLLSRSRLRARSRFGSDSRLDCHSLPKRCYATLKELRRSRLRGSVTSGSDSRVDCHSTPSVSLRYFAKAEETAKAKYERLKKLVEFYNV